MAITILERPIGVILGTCVDATINEDYNGFATVNKTAHGLSDDNWVYIQGNVENYNGFWQIDVINANEFALRNSDRTYVAHIVDADVSYCPQESTHGFSCVHLPITYKISNNRYPTNSIDTVRTITSLTSNNGFAQIGLSGSLGTFEDLQFIKISNAPNSDLNGVYQVIDKLSTTSVILNVAAGTFTNANIIGASIQLYYGNYNVVVRVYAGLGSSHDWTVEKPYELAATLELIPDEDNIIQFSVNDILKAYVKTENNLLLGTLPNNIDAYTNFYISTAEQYDTSNGYSVSTFQTGFTSDLATFEGTAVNNMLEFKNIHSGYLSAYLMKNTTAKFLTLFLTPVLFACGEETPDCYQDISFILPVYVATFPADPDSPPKYTIGQDFYTNGVMILQNVEIEFTYSDPGVYRVPMTEADCTYDRVDIYVNRYTLQSGNWVFDQIVSEVKTFEIDCGCADQEIKLTWINNLGGFDYWTFKAQTGHSIDIVQASETKKNIFPSWPKSWGENADTIRKQTSRTSTVKKFITSQILGSDLDDAIDKAQAIGYIKSSPLVQIINSRQDRRTVTVDTDSYLQYTDNDKNITISFSITYTDDIPSQRV